MAGSHGNRPANGPPQGPARGGGCEPHAGSRGEGRRAGPGLQSPGQRQRVTALLCPPSPAAAPSLRAPQGRAPLTLKDSGARSWGLGPETRPPWKEPTQPTTVRPCRQLPVLWASHSPTATPRPPSVSSSPSCKLPRGPLSPRPTRSVIPLLPAPRRPFPGEEMKTTEGNCPQTQRGWGGCPGTGLPGGGAASHRP